MATKLKWFDLAASAFATAFPDVLEKALPGIPPVCVCPLCLHAFPREAVERGVLTADHVPALCLGGRPLILTCWECNSEKWHKLDAQARSAENIVGVLKGELEHQHRVRLTVKNWSIEAVVQSTPAHFQFFGLPKQTNPKAFDGFFSEFERLAATRDTDSFIKIGFHRDAHSPQQVRVTWLRYGYLVAVALFGYRYALRPTWSNIREQLQDPETPILERFSMTDPSASPSTRQILLIDEPEYLRSLAVRMGRHIVLLPRGNDTGLYGRLKARSQRLSERLSGCEIPWPKEPMFQLDFQSPRTAQPRDMADSEWKA